MYIQVGIPLTVEWMAMNSHYIAHLCGNFINNSSGLRSFLSFLNMVKSNIKSITV
jgi:hypothetical protein